MSLTSVLYRLYERRLRRELPEQRPKHIGVILDGNRRWARELGQAASHGHKRGADKISDLLGWCDETSIEVVTLWLLSTDNLKRGHEELEELLEIIASAVETLASSGRWRLKIVGNFDYVPQDFKARVKAAEQATAGVDGLAVNVAVGYGGRQEIADAVRALLMERAADGQTLEDVARSFSVEDISTHLYTTGQPDPDLVIRTSGEQRMSGFMLWQTVHTELYFCEAYWPDFRRVDFLRALRDYAQRERRMGK